MNKGKRRQEKKTSITGDVNPKEENPLLNGSIGKKNEKNEYSILESENRKKYFFQLV